jgi:glycosyltransferase involved in cell wall biosynthesis
MEISKHYKDIITHHISEKDSGIYNAMNKGIKIATGDVVGFLNSDDTFSSTNVLSQIIGVFKDNPQKDIVYGDINYVRKDGKITRKWVTGEQKSFTKGWHPAHPGFYAKRHLFDDLGGFDEKLRIAADFDLMLRFIEVNKVGSIYLKKVCVNMKIGGESNKSLANILESSRDFRRSFEKYHIKTGINYILKRWIMKLLQSL